MLRSQLDAVHEYLPGNGTFDLKTRGTVAIRQDRMNYEVNLHHSPSVEASELTMDWDGSRRSLPQESAGYKIDRLRGPWESFEREYYVSSPFLLIRRL